MVTRENNIEEVSITHDGGALVATVVTDAPHVGEFAFYVFRNGERIHTQWYTPDPVLRFNTEGEPGLYRVLAFLGPSLNNISKYSNPLFLHPVTYSLSDAPRKLLPAERTLVLRGNNWEFPALYFPSAQHQCLFVMLSAAIDRSKHSLPVFNRWTWAHKFSGHVLCVADPTLELNADIRLGWYLGTQEHDATEELCRLIVHIADALGIPSRSIVFWGSSGGGFAALALASRIEEATAVAINAQTDVFAYENTRCIEAVRKSCFGGLSAEQIKAHCGPRVNMAQAWTKNRRSRAILVQNKLDKHHYEWHFQPFWKALGGSPEAGQQVEGAHYAWLYEDIRGHAPESEQMVSEILGLIDPNCVPPSAMSNLAVQKE